MSEEKTMAVATVVLADTAARVLELVAKRMLALPTMRKGWFPRVEVVPLNSVMQTILETAKHMSKGVQRLNTQKDDSNVR